MDKREEVHRILDKGLDISERFDYIYDAPDDNTRELFELAKELDTIVKSICDSLGVDVKQLGCYCEEE